MEYLRDDESAARQIPPNIREVLDRGRQAAETIINVLRRYYEEKADQLPGLYREPVESCLRLDSRNAWEDDGNTKTPGMEVVATYIWFLVPLGPDAPPHAGQVANGHARNCLAFTHEVTWRVRDHKNQKVGAFVFYFGGIGIFEKFHGTPQVRIDYARDEMLLEPNLKTLTTATVLIDALLRIQDVQNRLIPLLPKPR